MERTSAGTSLACPACGAPVPMGERPFVGETLRCPACEAHLEVAELAPLRLEPAAKVEEDEEDFAG